MVEFYEFTFEHVCVSFLWVISRWKFLDKEYAHFVYRLPFTCSSSIIPKHVTIDRNSHAIGNLFFHILANSTEYGNYFRPY
jgi:hypothetical protein